MKNNTSMGMKFKHFLHSEALVSFLSSLLAIFVGLLFGFIVILIANPSNALEAFSRLITAGIADPVQLGKVTYYATPIILTGLSVGFAFKTGLFNIGAPGQFIVGAFVAIYIGVKWTFLGSFQWVVALIGAGIAGGIWALVPGVLKAYRNVNEVIASIMMNYIGMSAVNFAIKNTVYNNLKNQTMAVAETAILPKWGLDKLLPNSIANSGFIIAILIAIVMYIVLNKTTFGYELKACGHNANAAKYAGISDKRNIMLSMVIAGILAGIGGGLLYLAGAGKYIEVVDQLANEGFNGIPVALLGLSNPIGTIFSGIFFAYLTVGGARIQTLGYTSQIVDIIVSCIVYFSAFGMIFKLFIKKFINRKGVDNNANADAGGEK